jgi:hypothetical protein
MYSIPLFLLALLLLGTANPLRAQDAPKQDESQQEGETSKIKSTEKKTKQNRKTKRRNEKRGKQYPGSAR